MANKIASLLSGYKTLFTNWNNRRDYSKWVFGEWFGRKCCDNCLYFANYLSEKHPEISLYWITEIGTNTDLLSDRIVVMYMDTEECKKVLLSAGIVVMNQEFYDFSTNGGNYFGGAITINLWHGLMWKKIGFDIRKKKNIFAQIYHKLERKIENADYWLVPSEETKKHFMTAYLIDDKHAIKCGYPRNMEFYEQSDIGLHRLNIEKRILQETDDVIKPDIIIAYMPTFRDKTEDVFSFLSLCKDPELDRILQKYNAVILEKSHYITSQRKNDTHAKNTNKRVLFMDNTQATELLAASDILITDYSSCFFDYLLLDRPIIHYIYDYDYYVNTDRGVYYTKEEIACGKTPQNINELLKAIEEYIKDPKIDHDLRMNRKELLWQYDSSDACEKIYQEIIKIQDGIR